MCTNPYERLAKLRQEASVDVYIDVFIALVSHVEGLSDQQSLGYFFSGLRDDIRIKIRSYENR